MIQVRGPECPRCGCRDAKVTAVVDSFAGKVERRACNHCGRRFTRSLDPAQPSDVPKIVDEPPPRRCPNCGAAGRDIKITGTRKPLRSLKCRCCGYPFQEVMQAAEF